MQISSTTTNNLSSLLNMLSGSNTQSCRPNPMPSVCNHHQWTVQLLRKKLI